MDKSKQHHSFRPDPPLERQVQTIEKYYQDLITIINEEIQRINDDDNDNNDNNINISQNLSTKNGPKNKNKKTSVITAKAVQINEMKSSLIEDTHLLYCDIWRCLRQAQKNNNGEEVQDMKSHLIKNFNEFKINIQNLRTELLNLLRDNVELKNSKIKDDTIIFNIVILMNDLVISVLNDLREIRNKSLSYHDAEFGSNVLTCIFDIFIDFTRGLQTFHYDLIKSVDVISRPINETAVFLESPIYLETSNNTINAQSKNDKMANNKLKIKKIKEFFDDLMNKFLSEFQEAVNLVHTMNHDLNEFLFTLYEEMRQNSQSGDEEPSFVEQFDIGALILPRSDSFANICNQYGSIFPTIKKIESLKNKSNSNGNNNKNETDGEYDENEEDNEDDEDIQKNGKIDIEVIWEKQRHIKYAEFVQSELKFTGKVLKEDLNAFWHIAHMYKIEEHSTVIGQYLFNMLDDRFSQHDLSLTAVDISETYYLSVYYGIDDEEEVVLDLESLLGAYVDQISSQLQVLRQRQLNELAVTPSSDDDNTLAKYTKKNNEMTATIRNLTFDLNLALYHGREASYILSQRRESNGERYRHGKHLHFDEEGNSNTENSESEENNSDYDYDYEGENGEFEDKFLIYDNEESDDIHKQLDKIIRLSDNAFISAQNKDASKLKGISKISTNSSSKLNHTTGGGSINNLKKRNSMGTTLGMFDTIGTKVPNSPNRSKKTTTKLTKSQKMNLMSQMTKEMWTKISCIEDALASTYLQLFASIKGTLIALIRMCKYDQANRVNAELQKRILEYTNHLNEIKIRADSTFDVKRIRVVEERISEMKSLGTTDLQKCIHESLKNVINTTILNFDQNSKKINDEFSDHVQKLKNRLGKKSNDMMENDHIPALVLIEKQRLIAHKKEETRTKEREFPEIEDAIHIHVKENQLDLADKERAKLDRARKKAIKDRFLEIEKEFDNKKKMKIEGLQDELLQMEKRFNKKVDRAKNKMCLEIEEQQRTLISSISTTLQRHLQFALNILEIDQKAKKEVPKKLNRIVQEVIKEKANEIEGIEKVLQNFFQKEKSSIGSASNSLH